MRVACLGNMNNNMFCLVRYLRERGLDAELLLLSHEKQHFLPASDSYDDAFQGYVRQLDWGAATDFAQTGADRIASDLAGYGAILACNYAPAFLEKARLGMDIFLPHGSDYYEVPFSRDGSGEPTPLAAAQLEAIRNAGHIFIPRMNEDQDRVWERIAPGGEFVHYPVPILYAPEYSPENIAQRYVPDAIYQEVEALGRRHDFVIFHHVRHCWNKTSPRTEHKGNDVFLRGLADFIARTGASPVLVTTEYGVDVDASKELVEVLGISGHVHWLPQMPRKRIMPLLGLSDIVAAEFAYSWICGGVLYEALCMSKPVICRRDDEYYANMQLFPSLRAATPEEVSAQLETFATNPNLYAEDGKRGRQWLEAEVLSPAVDAIVELLDRRVE